MRLYLLAVLSSLISACATTQHPDEAGQILALIDAPQRIGAVLSPSGKQVLFRSQQDGSPGLYLASLDAPKQAAVKLVGGPERIGSAIFSPDGKSVLYRQDTGADEDFHLFRKSLDHGAVVDLTPVGERLWRDTPFFLRGRADSLVYSARTLGKSESMLIMQALVGPPKVLFREPTGATVLDASADAVLWLHEAARGGHELLEITLQTGLARLVAPLDQQPGRITAAAYSADQRTILIAGDGGSETHSLRALDRQSLATIAVYEQHDPSAAALSAIAVGPRGDLLAVRVDAGDHSFLRLLDARTLVPLRDAKTPLGTIELGFDTEVRYANGSQAFDAEGRQLVIGCSTPGAPSDLYRVDLASGAATPLLAEARRSLEGLPPMTGSIEHLRAFDGLSIPVNVYLPTVRPGQKLPTIVSLHGGPDASTPFEWSAWNRVFTSRGYAVLEPNIRGSTGFGRAYELADDKEKRLDALEDVAAVNRWARAQPWCDAERLVLEGGSYGGYLVLMGLTHQPELWSAGIDLAGPSNLSTWLKKDSMPKRYLTEFGDPETEQELYRRLSPIEQVDRIVAPLFIYQGQNDSRVPRAEADRMVAALERRGVPVEYMLTVDEGHTVFHRDNQLRFFTRVLAFLRNPRKPDRPDLR